MSKLADSEFRALTARLLPSEEAMLQFFVDMVQKTQQRFFKLAEGEATGSAHNVEIMYAGKPIRLPRSNDADDPRTHLQALDALGFVAYAERADPRPGGTTLPDSVTVMPSAESRVRHRKRIWIQKQARLLALQTPNLLSFVALIISILVAMRSLAR
jgi:hypothetical protein